MQGFGHHHVAHKLVGNASFLQNFEQEMAAGGSTEPWVTLIATDGDEVKILSTLVAMQAPGARNQRTPASHS